MGKIIYDPRTKSKKQVEQEVVEVNDMNTASPEQRIEALIENLNSVRPVGDTDCDYAVYLEDYAYTYIYQYAQTDLACEHSAAIIGECYPETKEIIICGVMPIDKHRLDHVEEWINQEAIDSLYEEKEKYFPGASILGWLHMQPGYGTMLTMKEVKIHRELFNRDGSLLLLVDPINKIETFHVYEEDNLKEQSGYYIYYDKNPCMQKYMLDKPFISGEKEEVDDNVVSQFREIGQRRKREYQQRKRTNFTVVAASVALLAMAAILLRVGEQDKAIQDVAAKLSNQTNAVATKPSLPDGNADTETVPFVFEQVGLDEAAEDDSLEVGGLPSILEDDYADMQVDMDAEVAEEVTEEVDAEEVSSMLEELAAEEEGEELVLVNDELVAPQEEVAQQEVVEATDYRLYVVEDGDTLRKISMKHFNTELRTKDIIALNEIENGDHIFVGQQLKIPMK